MNFRLFFIVLVSSCFCFSLSAQKITLNPIHTINNYVLDDYYHDTIEFRITLGIKNNTTDSLSLIWERTIGDECPDEWSFGTYDKEFCYFPQVNSNVDEALNLDVQFVLEPEENFENYLIDFIPFSTPGCCHITIDFIDRLEPDIILETAIIDININSPDCNLSSLDQEIEEAQLISVYPNPNQGSFTLSNNDVVQYVYVFNSLGQKLKSFNFQNGEYMDITDLSTGIYTLVVMNAKWDVLNAMTLSKI